MMQGSQRYPSVQRGLVTVGMTIFNEAQWLRQALESILQQSYSDLEILVLDNASTDGSAAIAEEIAREDPRVSHVRHDRNLGANENYHRGVLQAGGEYFMMAAGHDLWEPDYVSTLVAALVECPQAVLAFGDGIPISEDGHRLPPKHDFCSTEGVRSPLHRFNLYMWAGQMPAYGLIRTDALRRIRTNLPVVASGQVFLQELAILGEFVSRPHAVFYRRQTRSREDRAARGERNIAALLPSGHRAVLPYWRVCLEIVRAAWRTPLKGRARRRLRFQLVTSSLAAFSRFYPYLVDDLRPRILVRRLFRFRSRS